MSSYLILFITITVVVVGMVNKVNCFDSFYQGTKNGLTAE